MKDKEFIDTLYSSILVSDQTMNFLMSETCKKLLKENNIQLITWREIRDKLLR